MDFITKKLMSGKGNFEKIIPALRRTFAIAIRHIYHELETHCAQPHQNIAAFKSTLTVPIDNTPDSCLVGVMHWHPWQSIHYGMNWAYMFKKN